MLVRCGLELVGNPLPKDRDGRPPSISILVDTACQTINLATSCRNEKLSERGYLAMRNGSRHFGCRGARCCSTNIHTQVANIAPNISVNELSSIGKIIKCQQEAMHQALTMSNQEKRQRAECPRSLIESHDVTDWLQQQLSTIVKLKL